MASRGHILVLSIKHVVPIIINMICQKKIAYLKYLTLSAQAEFLFVNVQLIISNSNLILIIYSIFQSTLPSFNVL